MQLLDLDTNNKCITDIISLTINTAMHTICKKFDLK